MEVFIERVVCFLLFRKAAGLDRASNNATSMALEEYQVSANGNTHKEYLSIDSLLLFCGRIDYHSKVGWLTHSDRICTANVSFQIHRLSKIFPVTGYSCEGEGRRDVFGRFTATEDLSSSSSIP